jgi:hypothetical protein
MSVVMDEIFILGIEIGGDGILLVGTEKRAYVGFTPKGFHYLFQGVSLYDNV